MPLDFTASGLTHSKPAGTLDFTVPEHLLFQFDIDGGALTHIASGHISGQFLESQWNGQPVYHAPGGVVVPAWHSSPIYIGVGHSGEGEEFGTFTIFSDQVIYQSSFGGSEFGAVQTSPTSVYLHPTGGDLTVRWDDVPYSSSQGNQGGSWSDVVIVAPLSIEPTVAYGEPSIVQEQFISLAGIDSAVFGASYVLRWFEYAPPVFTLNTSWLGENEYTAPIHSVNVNWLPSTGAQTVGPVSFDQSSVSSPRVVSLVQPTSIGDDSEFGSPTLIVRNLELEVASGESLELVDLETEIRIEPEFFAGAGIFDSACEELTGFENVASGEPASISETGFRLQNSGAAHVGSNVAVNPVDVSNVSSVSFSWNQNLSGPWFDNDESDASVHFGLFFDRALADITSLGSTWEYDTPFDAYTVGNNRPWLNFWLPRDALAKTITPRGRLADGTSIGAVAFTKPAGIDLYGDSLITVTLINDSGKIRFEIYADGVLLNTQITPHIWPDTVAPLWYYRNYSNAGSYVDITNVKMCGGGLGLLQTYPSGTISFAVDIFEGEELSAQLATEALLKLNAYSGEYGSAVLEINPRDEFTFGVYDGAEASAQLATDATFGFDSYDGENLSLVITMPAVAEFALNYYDGAEVATSLWTQSTLAPHIYSGEAASVDIAINPASELVIDNGEGGAASLGDLSTAIQFGNTRGYSGGRLDASLDTLENWHLYDGTSVTIAIATDVSLSAAGYAGESASATLSTFPSEGLGVFYAYEGAQALASFTTLPQVLLYPNEIKVPDAFHYDILGHMGIDLNNGTCCPVVDNHARIELSDGPAPDERYDGDKVVVQVDLSTLPRFSMGFAEGAHFEGVDPEYFTISFFDGQAGITSDLQFDEYNFNLCKGNFIPDGDHINVELISNDLNNCEAIVMFDGAESNLDLSATPQFAAPLPTGERFDFDFVIIPALVFRFYTGEFVRISNPEFSPHFVEDAYTNFVFEEKDIVGYSGAEMTLLSLTTDYDVEFLERGCLDNEFVPSNETGDPDMERFNPVPVELDFFTHSIRARCY